MLHQKQNLFWRINGLMYCDFEFFERSCKTFFIVAEFFSDFGMSDLRHTVEKVCKRSLGSIDETIVDKIVSGVKLNYTRDALIGRLQPRIDERVATKLVDKVFSKVEKSENVSVSHKR